MKRSPRTKSPCPKRRNLPAIAVSFSALSFLYFNFDPTPAGADPASFEAAAFAEAMSADTEAIFAEATPTPVPVATASLGSEVPVTTTVAQPAVANDRITAIIDLLADGQGIDLPRNLDGVVWDDNRLLILSNIVILKRGLAKLDTIPSYTANFFKQERVDGTLLDGQMVQMKIQHEPFGVYMKWITGDKGRELLYVDGENEGKMLVHAGGWKARLVPALKLDPEGSIAMRESRHPCTMAGLRGMMLKMLADRENDLVYADDVDYAVAENQTFDDRDCIAFQVEHFAREHSPVYRKSVYFFDREHSIPLFVKNHGWPAEGAEVDPATLDDETLIEHYTFTELDLATRLASADFERTNRKYKFRR